MADLVMLIIAFKSMIRVGLHVYPFVIRSLLVEIRWLSRDNPLLWIMVIYNDILFDLIIFN